MVQMVSNDECFTIKVFLNQFSIFLQHVFVFDEVFDSACSNHDVYEGTAKPLVQHVLQGYVKINCNNFIPFLSSYSDLVKYSAFFHKHTMYECVNVL